ncbi:MAG: ATP-binding protein [Pirellula sp.]
MKSSGVEFFNTPLECAHSWSVLPASEQSNRLTVLLVEDDPALRRLVKHGLENRSFQVIECSTYAEANNAIDAREVALAIVDLSLPDASGGLVLQKIAKQFPNTKVLIFTSSSDLSSAVEAIEHRAFAFVEKSLGIHHLMSQVERASVAYLRDALSASQLENNLQISLLDAIDEAAIATDTRFRIIFANRFSRELIGVGDLPLLGERIDQFVSVSDAKGNLDRRTILNMHRSLRTGECWNAEVYLTCAPIPQFSTPTNTFPTNLRVTPILANGKMIQGYIAVFSNIHNERQLRYELDEQRNRLMKSGRLTEEGRLAGTLAHEINQPLGAISNYASSLLKGIEIGSLSPTQVCETISIIQKQANRASQVIKRLREFLRREPPKYEKIEIQQLIRETLQLLRLELERNDIQVRTRFRKKPIVFSGDSVQLQQVFVNVIGNAIDALSESNDGERMIQIVAENCGQKIHLQVSDNGPGIQDEKLLRIFDPYFTTKPLGMGLGLCICREIVEAHQGKIQVLRSSPHGTTLEIIFPIAQRAA